MKIKIEVFNSLDSIARNHRVNDVEWSKSAKIRQPSISELRRLYLERNAERSINRACTVEKLGALFIGLYNILGG